MPRLVALFAGALLASGCGTVGNLLSDPNGKDFLEKCYPFGGVARSTSTAVTGTVLGMFMVGDGLTGVLSGNFEEGKSTFEAGALLTGLGLTSAADAPVSLAGDVITLPVVIARLNGASWASWPSWDSPGKQDSVPAETERSTTEIWEKYWFGSNPKSSAQVATP